jgi:hypothetical protein
MPNVHIGFSWDSDTVTYNISIISYWLMAAGMDGGLGFRERWGVGGYLYIITSEDF